MTSTVPHVRPILEQQRQLLGDLSRLAAECTSAEAQLSRAAQDDVRHRRTEHERLREQSLAAFEERHSQLLREYEREREDVFSRYETEAAELQLEATKFRALVAEQLEQAHRELQKDVERRQKQAESKYQSREKTLAKEDVQFQEECNSYELQLQAILQDAENVLGQRRLRLGDPVGPVPLLTSSSRSECLVRHRQAASLAGDWLQAISNERCSRILEEGWVVLILIFSFIAAIYPYWLWLGVWGWPSVLGASAVSAGLLALVVRQAMWPLARRRTQRMVPAFQKAIAEARGYSSLALSASRAAIENARQQYAKRRDEKIALAVEQFAAARDKNQANHDAQIQSAANLAAEKRSALENRHEREFLELETRYPPRVEREEKQLFALLAEQARQFRETDERLQAQLQQNIDHLTTRWKTELDQFTETVAQMNDYRARKFAPWNEPQSVSAATNGVASVPFGSYEFHLDNVQPPRAKDSRLLWPDRPFTLPAAISFPESPSLIFETEAEGREAAVHCMRNIMLRLLTAFPPGKVRFTILDPIGLGENFSAFMHLADFDERLVANRIWTEAAHVQQKMTDLTEHMENVIQKYLRNEYDSILAYNDEAGEVAEPFQILVVANFPANFSEEAARRLVSIAASGPRCGVYTLMSFDRRQTLPRDFDVNDLKSSATTLSWNQRQSRFEWDNADLRSLPLTFDEPPPHDRFTALVREVGERARGSQRVEVPFASVLPPPEAWWNSNSRDGIEVPLGRAGAKKLQYLRLGKGTSQHVLIAGKTGSGKSTLLNSVITNLAAHYAPSELEFYLIDFKKGVEFKAYASARLPHARVIAIESEREFGLSVLERLDDELKRRGDLFRAQGAHDVASFRTANPQAVLPRILLIIDEFQEFFTNDDKISSESSLLLDRLVRQGRAFGVHVMLGSQTLAGAYSLARSTLGQMAVRIALQCSESDAHLILSEDNTAARLLSRPGEAIYNDANGLFEGNHPFQVVWLSDKERETQLARIAALARERNVPPGLRTVFEGNVSADPQENPYLCEVLRSPAQRTAEATPRAWLGAAVAIKEPTHVVFRRQGGENLLLIGQHDNLAQGTMYACLSAILAQLPFPESIPSFAENNPSTEIAASATPPCYVFDAVPPDSPEAALWHANVPGVKHVSPRHAVDVLKELATEVERRGSQAEHAAPSRFLFIYNLARFRELKKADDFGIGGFGEDDSRQPAKDLATVLRDGPAVGIHSIIWCDSYSNLSRWLERASVRDLAMRVLFQMSSADSSNLMDNPAASRLGAHMAIYFNEEQGEVEKFRPYAIPSASWRLILAACQAERNAATATASALSPTSAIPRT